MSANPEFLWKNPIVDVLLRNHIKTLSTIKERKTSADFFESKSHTKADYIPFVMQKKRLSDSKGETCGALIPVIPELNS